MISSDEAGEPGPDKKTYFDVRSFLFIIVVWAPCGGPVWRPAS